MMEISGPSPVATPSREQPPLSPAVARRRQAFVDTAREAFFELGFGNATMSSIASRVGGSKTTLWSYFPSKEALFAAVVDDIVEHYGSALKVELDPRKDIASTLREFGTVLVRMLVTEPMVSLYRLVVAEAVRFPHLAEMFYERGPKRGKGRLTDYFSALMDEGKLRRDEPVCAMQQFVSLCQSRHCQMAMLDLNENRALPDIETDVEKAVDTFLRAWKSD